jgi:hypothetical protein
MPHCEHAAITTAFRTGAFLPAGVADQISKNPPKSNVKFFHELAGNCQKWLAVSR